LTRNGSGIDKICNCGKEACYVACQGYFLFAVLYNPGAAIGCHKNLDSFNQFEKRVIDFQIKLIQQMRVFARMKRCVSSFWALTVNLLIIRHTGAVLAGG
jgi:hypothetical protein